MSVSLLSTPAQSVKVAAEFMNGSIGESEAQFITEKGYFSGARVVNFAAY
jgi:hypothetical protein